MIDPFKLNDKQNISKYLCFHERYLSCAVCKLNTLIKSEANGRKYK